MKQFGMSLISGLILCIGVAMNSMAQLLPAPTLLSPPNNSQMPINQAVQPILFSWEASEGAELYEINLLIERPNQNALPLPPRTTESTSIEIELGLSADDTNTEITWSVRAIENGRTSVSEPFTFTTASSVTPTPTPNPFGLPAPELVQPEKKALFTLEEALGNGVGGVEFEWKRVTGAASYLLLIYRDNDDFIRRPSQNTTSIEQIQTNIEDTFQWEVRAIDADGEEGQVGLRRSFTVSDPQILPTPTPFPVSVDMDSSGTITAEDVYRFSSKFLTNDPKVDFDNSGLNNAEDILQFVDRYRQEK